MGEVKLSLGAEIFTEITFVVHIQGNAATQPLCQRFVLQIGLESVNTKICQGHFQVQFWIFNGESFGEPGKGSLAFYGSQAGFGLIPKSKLESNFLAGSEVSSFNGYVGKVVNSFLTRQGQRVAQANPTLIYVELFDENFHRERGTGRSRTIVRGGSIFGCWFFGSLAARLGRCLFTLGGGGSKIQRYHRLIQQQGIHYDFFGQQGKNRHLGIDARQVQVPGKGSGSFGGKAVSLQPDTIADAPGEMAEGNLSPHGLFELRGYEPIIAIQVEKLGNDESGSDRHHHENSEDDANLFPSG